MTLLTDPSIVVATKNELNHHISATDPHPQYWNDTRGREKIAAAVAALVDSSPKALDTLQELAAALGNDANFSTTITNSLASKASIAQAQSGLLSYAIDSGTANAYVVTLSPAITAYADGVKIRFRALTANTGASTLNVNGLGAVALVGGAHAALAGGEIIPGGYCEAEYNGSLSKFALLECTGAPMQVANATASQHAVPLGQADGRYLSASVAASVQGVYKNLKILSQGATNTSSVITADMVVLQNSTGAQKVVSAINLTPSFANTIGQPLALSTGTWTASTFYYIYLWNNGTTTTATFDPSPTAPTAPAGYTSGYLNRPGNCGGSLI